MAVIEFRVPKLGLEPSDFIYQSLIPLGGFSYWSLVSIIKGNSVIHAKDLILEVSNDATQPEEYVVYFEHYGSANSTLSYMACWTYMRAITEAFPHYANASKYRVDFDLWKPWSNRVGKRAPYVIVSGVQSAILNSMDLL